jgi:hypothetical protein
MRPVPKAPAGWRDPKRGDRGRFISAFRFPLSAFCLRAWGQYSIDWSTIDGGGGTGRGGIYSVTGTISVTFTNKPANGAQFFRLHKP